ncbi:MAG: hypothetical protein [Microviridae sp.]|nr:MAG: hypothetical protein [Microviridae sp.]
MVTRSVGIFWQFNLPGLDMFPAFRYLCIVERMEKSLCGLQTARDRDCSGNPAQAERGGIAAESPALQGSPKMSSSVSCACLSRARFRRYCLILASLFFCFSLSHSSGSSPYSFFARFW